MKKALQTTYEGIGAALIVTGIALWSIPLALIVAGAALLLMANPLPIRRGGKR